MPGEDTLKTIGNHPSAIDARHLFIVGNEYHLSSIGRSYLTSSSDGGDSWHTTYRATNANLERVAFRDTLNGLGSGIRCLLAKSDGGRSWTTELDTFMGFSQISVERGHRGMAVSRTRGVVMIRTEAPSGVSVPDGEVSNLELVADAPGHFVISSPQSADATVRVFDVLGRVVWHRSFGVVAERPQPFDVIGMSPGV